MIADAVYAFEVRRTLLRAMESTAVSRSRQVADLHRDLVGDVAREHFAVYYLDAGNRVIGRELVAIGSAHEVSVLPSEVFRGALLAGAYAIIAAHNHPSGLVEPSAADDQMTQRLRAAGDLIGITVLDHVVVGADKHFSYADWGR